MAGLYWWIMWSQGTRLTVPEQTGSWQPTYTHTDTQTNRHGPIALPNRRDKERKEETYTFSPFSLTHTNSFQGCFADLKMRKHTHK